MAHRFFQKKGTFVQTRRHLQICCLFCQHSMSKTCISTLLKIRCNNSFPHQSGCSKLSFEQIGLAPILSFALSLCVNFDNCLFETTQLGINLPIHSFTIVEQKFENYLCITCKTLRLSSLSICSFTRFEENFKNCVCKTTQIGTNLAIRSFTLFEEDFENCLIKRLRLASIYLFTSPPQLRKI